MPREVLQFLPGDGETGKRLVANEAIAGVVFTGSTEAAQSINRTLARRLGRDGKPLPLIAETGGQNASGRRFVGAARAARAGCADFRLRFSRAALLGAAGALPARGYCGPRCPSARGRNGRARRRQSGPAVGGCRGRSSRRRRRSACSIISRACGPLVIARTRWRYRRKRDAWRFRPADLDRDRRGVDLPGEVFGPVLHVLRYKRDRMTDTIKVVNATGFGLTFGVHSRIDETIERAVAGQCGRQSICEPQHDRRRGRRAALRWSWTLGHRPQGRRAALCASTPVEATKCRWTCKRTRGAGR